MRSHRASPARPAAGFLPAFALLLLLLVPPTGWAQDVATLLAYDNTRPLDLHVLKREVRAGAVVEDITFNGASGTHLVTATLVRPAEARGPYAGILWGHWLEPSAANSNRTEFVDEAVALARLGVVSVMPDALWSDVTWFDTRSWRDDFTSTVDQARDFRRTLDVLLAQRGVSPTRVAFVGHDFSAMHGALLTAVETRVKAWVLLAGTARWSDWYLFGASDGVPSGHELTAYLAQLAVIDPVATIASAKVSVLFQFGESDFFTPRANFTAFYSAGPKRTTRIATYAVAHALDLPIVRFDRDQFLVEQLGLRPFAF